MDARRPIRLKDLPPPEPDSDDEFKTPIKSKHASGVDTFGNMRIPKKVAELSPLESDSEDEFQIDPLNSAILNYSFILSPSKDLPGETPIARKMVETSTSNKDDSFAKHFQQMSLTEKENRAAFPATQPKSRHELFPSSTTPIGHNQFPGQNALLPLGPNKCPLLPTSVENFKCDSNRLNSTTASLQETGTKSNLPSKSELNAVELSPPVITAKPTITHEILKSSTRQSVKCAQLEHNEVATSSSKDLVTPFKSAENHFVTPQVKYQMPVSRRPNFSSSTLQKSESAIENEFKSQKILFRTPIALSRPPAALAKENDIVSKEHKLSPVKEVAARKSTEDLFKNENVVQSTDRQQKQKSGDEKIVTINGHDYVVMKKLGSGGSSSVFLAKRKDIQKECALKVVDLRDEQAAEGYLNETKLLAKLQGNLNVVSLYEYQHLPSEFKLYMVMEKGESDLNKILQSYKTDLPLYVLMSFWHQMLQSVSYIHENGVIHSDLKPANFLMVNGRLKLIDFGIASNISIDSTSIIKFSQAGTFNYISPEALIDTSTGNSPVSKNRPKIRISKKSDVWSLGCILYLLLYKKTPFGQIKNIYAKVNAITDPKTQIEYSELSIYYPPVLIEMAKKCLVHDPKKRSSVADLLKYRFDMILPLK